MSDQMTTADGLTLRTRADHPPGPPRARVVLVHGLGDHVDGLPYMTAATALAARGLEVHRLELRGHGRSGGPRVHVGAFEDFRRDLGQFVARVHARSPPTPLFLVGMSLGGLIVTSYALHHPDGLSGVVAAAAALGDTGGSPFLKAILPVLARVAPGVRLDPKLDLDKLTRDRALLKAYVDDDPLYQRRITPRLAAEVLAAVPATRARAGDFRVPLLVLHGTADTVTSPADSHDFCALAGVADKTFKAYEGAYHNLFVETNREEVFDDIAAWIGERA
jgi:alpha-beta hydrolase superfamily lysophospholipase